MALLAFLIVAATWGVYWPLIRRHRVPREPRAYQAAMAVAAVLALVAIARVPGIAGWLFALAALIGAGFFLFTTLTSAMPATQPPHVGERYLDFAAKDWLGRDFRLSSLDGRRFILKFYRGHW
jgi:hypothetical protein